MSIFLVPERGPETKRRIKLMNKYEVLYILDGKLSEEAVETQVEKYKTLVTSSGGTIEKADKWGMKKFAYPIEKKSEGYYILMNFSAKPGFPAEMERQMKISDEVMRYIVINRN